MTLVEIHARMGNTTLYYFIIMAIWGLIGFARRQGVSSGYWGALVIAEILIVAQAAMGGYMWLSGLRPARTVHLLYGVISCLAIPAVYAYTRGRDNRRDMLLYGASLLVTVGLILRAILTAG